MTPSATSALLPQEPVLLVQGWLAAALGLAPALFLQQVHYWLLRSHHEFGGQPWIYNTYAQWQTQFPFLSRDQLARAVATLRRLGVLQVGHWDADRRERRNWYSIDYARLATVLGADERSAPVTADLADCGPGIGTTAPPNTTSTPTIDSVTVFPLPATESDGTGISARPCPTDRMPMVQICMMDDSPVAPHPEITPAEITQRLPQEEDDTPAHLSPPPPPAPCVSEATPITPAAPLPVPGVALANSVPSASGDAEPWDGIALPSAPARICGVLSMRPFTPIVDSSVSGSTNRTSHFRVPTSAFVWGAYRAALDPGAPPALRTRIAADLAGAAARRVPLTTRGLTYALEEAATARGPRWPYLFAIWQQHPDGLEVGTPRAEVRSKPNPAYAPPGPRAGRFPPPLDASKYAAGGKYGHLFARPAPAVT